MSAHKDPKYQAPELVAALRAHGFQTTFPSQLSDAFRFGWTAAIALPVEPPAMASPYVTQEQFDRVFPDAPPPVASDAALLDWVAVNGSFGVDSVTGEVGGNGQKRKAATRTNIAAAIAAGAAGGGQK